MKYYVGKGTEFKKEECKEYKTLDGALKAAAKDESLVVWDENGQVVGSLTGNVPEGALATNPDGTVNAYNDDGQQVGTVDHATVAAVTGDDTAGQAAGNTGASTDDENGTDAKNEPSANENGQNGANNDAEGEDETQSGDDDTASQETGDEDEVIIPQGTMKVTVVCDGALNLRRSASWGNDNICGRAARGQSYYVKEIHTIDGKKMVRTIDDLYLSGASEHVQFEQL